MLCLKSGLDTQQYTTHTHCQISVSSLGQSWLQLVLHFSSELIIIWWFIFHSYSRWEQVQHYLKTTDMTERWVGYPCNDCMESFIWMSDKLVTMRHLLYGNLQELLAGSVDISNRLFFVVHDHDYLSFKSFDFECTCWRLFQKRAVRNKFDIYIFIPL
jgi:hypothetical protein